MHRSCGNRDHNPIARIKYFMARHRGRHGGWGRFGGFGGGFGDGFGPFMAGRKLGARDLELLILALLAEQPLHGYKIIKELEERSKGFYVPSPGMIYPSLAFLEEIGRVVAEAEGVKKLYRLTDEGRAHLEANRNEANALLAQLTLIGSKMEQMREFFSEEDGNDLRDAIHALRAAVRGKRHAAPEERKRVADILKRAAGEILKN
ncbi:MAG: PadR family transcriptional regulator [Rhodospirillaceae bacterium]|nr:MAG: PadR family transcriptional regulator [Rhodospirillaceae bacterium]